MEALMLVSAHQQELVTAMQLSPNPYVVLDAHLRFSDMNAAFLQEVMKSRDDLIGQNLFEIFTTGDAREIHLIKHSLETVLHTGTSHSVPIIYFPVAVEDKAGVRFLRNRYWSLSHSPIKNAKGEVTHILQQIQDVSEAAHLRKAVANLHGAKGKLDLDEGMRLQVDNLRLACERSQLMDMFIQSPGFVAILYGESHRILMINAACARLLGQRDVLGKPLKAALPELVSQGYTAAAEQVYRTGVSYQARQAVVYLDNPLKDYPDERHLDFMFHPLRDADGQIGGIFVQGHDVTDSVLADQRQKLMIDELNHRVKNTLATVQSIALQTARSHLDPNSFAEAFQSRILALSHTHDLLTQSHWEGAYLSDVIRHEIEAYGPNRLTLEGPAIALEPAMAVSLGMVFHELATNAAKYGALTPGSGHVVVNWHLEHENSQLNLYWSEREGPCAPPPKRRGFGSRLIERNVRHDLSGKVETYYTPTGFKAEFSIPLSKEGL